ncbi:unnamed protein product [Microthlaspi erraticum]|uniref:Uncharacterized protein n=1 Tax=Microthlaspi erraticum TaxID=1685480 RepID=A0A6D2IN91_9BRAS|nr:unnamed protein product [Microthlaspi erraticum]
MFLRPTPHPQRFQGPSLCQHVGTWSPQSPWRREHCSALGTWGVLLLLLLLLWLNLLHGSSWFPSCHLHQPIGSPLLLPLHSQSHHSFFIWRTISLLLNKVHSNLKLSSFNLSLSDFPQSRHIPLHQTLPSSDPSSSNRLAS